MSEPSLDHQVNPARIVYLVVIWALLVAILIGAGRFVSHSDAVQHFDGRITSRIVDHRSAGLDAAMKACTWLGSWVALLLAAALTLALVLRRLLPAGFLVLAVVTWAGTQGGTTIAKHVVHRSRPPQSLWLVSAHGWSWPSGHTSTATLIFSVLAVEVWVLIPRVGPRLLAIAGAVTGVALVGFSRVELGVHWTTDVLASVIFASTWLLSAGTVVRSSIRPEIRSEPGSEPT